MTVTELATPVARPGIEGRYEEIVEYLDMHPGNGVGFTDFHGGHGNVGLFSVRDTHNDNYQSCGFCHRDVAGGTAFECDFNILKVDIDLMPPFHKVDVERPDKTHLIVF